MSLVVFLPELIHFPPMVLVCADTDGQEDSGNCNEDHAHDNRQDIVD